MLRESSLHLGLTVHLPAIVNRSTDCHIEQGEALLVLAEALVADDHSATTTARDHLVQATGEVFTATAIGIVANFQMMNRLLDATGVPVPRRYLAVAEQLGI